MASLFEKISSSGPLMAQAGLGLSLLFVPESGFSASYDVLFRWARPDVWGVACIVCCAIGYIGLWRCNSPLWRLGHGFAVCIFLVLASSFLTPYFIWLIELTFIGDAQFPSSAPTGVTTYLALSLNACVRYLGTYYDPFAQSYGGSIKKPHADRYRGIRQK